MIINTQTIKKSGGGRGTYQVEAGFLSGYNELIRPSLHTPDGSAIILSDNPADYTKVDWLSNGATGAIIVLPFYPNNNSRIKLSVKTDNNDSRLAGARRDAINQAFTVSIYQSSVFSDYGTERINLSVTLSGGFDVIDKNKRNVYLNGNLIGTNASATFSSPVPMALFDWNQNAGLMGPTTDEIIMEYAQVYDNDNLSYDLIPVYYNFYPINGMFDAIHNRFYMAQRGTFEIPSDTSNEINLATYLANR